MILYVGRKEKGYFMEEAAKAVEDTVLYTGYVSSISQAFSKMTNKYYRAIAIDVEGLIDRAEDMAKEAEKIKNTYQNTRIIIVAMGYSTKTKCVQDFYKSGFHDFVLAVLPGDAIEEARKCLTGFYDENPGPIVEEEKTRDEKIDLPMIEPKTIYKKTLAFAGATPHIGVTTQAIQMAKYLQLQGKTVCYIEANQSQFLYRLIETYDEDSVTFDEKIGRITYANLDFFLMSSVRKALLQNYEYYIYDYGCYFHPAYNRLSFLEKDISIYIGGCNPGELMDYRNLMIDTIEEQKAFYIFSHVHEEEKEELLMMMEDKRDKTLFASYAPNPFLYEPSVIYEKIVPFGQRKEKKQEKKRRRFWRK